MSKLSSLILILTLTLLGSTGANPHVDSDSRGPLTKLEARVEPDGRVTLRFELPELQPDEQVLSNKLLRSTTDLSLLRRIRRFPVAEVSLPWGTRSYLDELAPQGVSLYYQMVTQTSKRNQYQSQVAEVSLPAPEVDGLADPSLLVDKADYSLQLLDKGKVVRRFPIALGADSTGRKLHQDRASTPEGVYRIAALQSSALHHRAIDLDYPNARDKSRYNFFQSQGLLPYPPPEIGGDIQIHGDGITSNWTWGCMAMRNEDLDWLFARPELKEGIEVRIVGSELRPADLELEQRLTQEEYLQLKMSLEKLGYEVDELGGERWYQAISRFQKDNGLPITGILDQLTRARLLESTKKYGFRQELVAPNQPLRPVVCKPKYLTLGHYA